VIVKLVSAVTAIVIVELCLKVFKGNWIKTEVASLMHNMQTFLRAQDDAERQRLLIQNGLSTLRFSLVFASFMGLLVGIACLAPWALTWTESQQTSYVVATSVVGTAWWLLRVLKKSPL
jgi:hypothetical protein